MSRGMRPEPGTVGASFLDGAIARADETSDGTVRVSGRMLRLLLDSQREYVRDARNLGYREGRLAAWQELVEWAQENETIAAREVALTPAQPVPYEYGAAVIPGANPVRTPAETFLNHNPRTVFPTEDQFVRLATAVMQVRDFLALHRKATGRSDVNIRKVLALIDAALREGVTSDGK